MNWIMAHGTNDLAKSFLRDAHFMHTIYNNRNNTLLIESKTNALWDTLGCESLPQNGKTHLCSMYSSIDCIYYLYPRLCIQ